MAGEDLVGGDLTQVLQGAVAGFHDGAVDLGAGEDLAGGGGAEPGLQDGRGVGVLAEFVDVQQVGCSRSGGEPSADVRSTP
ncbi:hypothetical protein GCM10017688_41290 [Streptomyces ramulosus]